MSQLVFSPGSGPQPQHETIKASQFGRDFVWGTATASYQIEGAWNIDGKGESIWDHFSHHTRRVKNRDNGDVACDFYHRYESDIERMRDMQIPAFRFSISWPRLLPDGKGRVNQQGVDFYHRVIDKCLKENIEPWVTCYHWDLPQKLQEKGGWVNRDSVTWFEEFVSLCAREYGDKVKHWMVFNEPGSFTMLGYLLGVHAPGKLGWGKFLRSVHHVNLSQAAGGRILKANVRDGNIGTSFSCNPVYAAKDTPAHDKARKRLDALLHRIYIEPMLGMGYPVADLPALRKLDDIIQPGDEQAIVHDFDFIGLQNYTRVIVRPAFFIPYLKLLPVFRKKGEAEFTEMNWEVFPEGIYRVIKQYAAYDKIKKIYITENGAAFKDQVQDDQVQDAQRTRFLQDYLAQVLKAKQEGVDIGGYFVWSFLDNFEWHEGYRPRFGIVHVDYATQQRTIKDSGKWFSEFLRH